MEHIEKAYQAGVITEEEKRLIEEYNQRLTDNNVPVIYNLRHLRQLLGIHKSVIPTGFFTFQRKMVD